MTLRHDAPPELRHPPEQVDPHHQPPLAPPLRLHLSIKVRVASRHRVEEPDPLEPLPRDELAVARPVEAPTRASALPVQRTVFGANLRALGAAVTARVGRALAAGGLLSALAGAAGLSEKAAVDGDRSVQLRATDDRVWHDPRVAPLEGEREARSPLR